MQDLTHAPEVPARPAPAESMVERAERILSGDIRPEDYLPVTPEVTAGVELDKWFVRTEYGFSMTAEAERRQLNQHLLRVHHPGQQVVCVRDEKGTIILASGLEEYPQFIRVFAGRPGLRVSTDFHPHEWEADRSAYLCPPSGADLADEVFTLWWVLTPGGITHPEPSKRESVLSQTIRQLLLNFDDFFVGGGRTGALSLIVKGSYACGDVPGDELDILEADFRQHLPRVISSGEDYLVSDRPHRPEVGGVTVQARFCCRDSMVERAERILSKDIRPEDYLPVTPEVKAGVERDKTFVRESLGLELTEEAVARQLERHLLRVHHPGREVECIRDSQGLVVLASGPEEIFRFNRAFSDDRMQGEFSTRHSPH